MTTKRLIVGLSSGLLICVAVFFVMTRPRMPGDQPSPKLVDMFNRAIDAELLRIAGPPFIGSLYPPYRPDAADSARRWLSQLREVVTHCEYGALMRRNRHVLDGTLQSGETFTDTTAALYGCLPTYTTPMRVTFERGRVVQVTTDGSEREGSRAVAEDLVRGYVGSLVQYDANLHPERYYVESPNFDRAKEWDAP